MAQRAKMPDGLHRTDALESLADIVRRMREVQKRYFRHRRPDDLTLAKQYEADVDRHISMLFDHQGKLF